MKRILFVMLIFASFVQVANAQVRPGRYDDSCSSGSSFSQSTNASITIMNRSDYSLTVKILRTGGRGLYRTVSISPQSYSVVTFSSSDTFFTKTKAVKGGLLGETLYRKGSSFSVQCDSNGYTEGTLEFYVSSGSGSSGTSISKSEFESNK